MSRHFLKLLASFFLIAGLTAPAQIIRLGAPKKSSADAGVNSVQAPVPTPLSQREKGFHLLRARRRHRLSRRLQRRSGARLQRVLFRHEGLEPLRSRRRPQRRRCRLRRPFRRLAKTQSPQIRIGIADAKTHITLWGFVEQVDFKFRKKNRDTAFTDSVKLLVTDIQTLIGQNATPPPVTP